MLKTVSDQPHIVYYVTYGLPFYGIVWILVRQRPFMDYEIGNDFLGLFGNTFWLGLASCRSRFIIFYVLFIYLYFSIFYFLFFIFLPSIRSEFLLRGVPIHILVFVNLFLLLLLLLLWFLGGAVGEFIFGTVAC